ncbi:aminoglycoside phosphotransferase family protein [Kribbella sp. NPDC051587]|uniref:aminoglycoside phosphotransferase family protein n=1 Tax=Kribbella sp. NPDC051587 TaxID=3364119 RepID=UPI00379E60C0
MPNYIKRRAPEKAGSIAAALKMAESEIRFYREVAPEIGIRVPACYRAELDDEGSLLELEDLSAWRQGAEPAAAAELLRSMHDRWTGRAHVRWPWLRSIGTGEELVARLYDETWPKLAARSLPASVREFGERMVGNVQQAEAQLLDAGPLTLVHGDASAPNLRTSPEGEIVLLDWEDVSAAPGVLDLAWHLISSVEPSRWPEMLAAYGPADGLIEVLPSTMVQGYLSMSDWPADSEEAAGFAARLEAGTALL